MNLSAQELAVVGTLSGAFIGGLFGILDRMDFKAFRGT
jgi:uncharacterized membrane protein